MDGWLDGWMDGSGFVGRWVDGWIDGWMFGWMDMDIGLYSPGLKVRMACGFPKLS